MTSTRTAPTSHDTCSHERTKAGRAACRKARAAGTTVVVAAPAAGVTVVPVTVLAPKLVGQARAEALQARLVAAGLSLAQVA